MGRFLQLEKFVFQINFFLWAVQGRLQASNHVDQYTCIPCPRPRVHGNRRLLEHGTWLLSGPFKMGRRKLKDLVRPSKVDLKVNC
jgi:hypothetical protein